MATAAIDLDMLNELFDNQKNLDDILNEDFFLDSSILVDDEESETSTLKDNLDIQFNKDMLSNSENKYFLQDGRRIIKPYSACDIGNCNNILRDNLFFLTFGNLVVLCPRLCEDPHIIGAACTSSVESLKLDFPQLL